MTETKYKSLKASRCRTINNLKQRTPNENVYLHGIVTIYKENQSIEQKGT